MEEEETSQEEEEEEEEWLEEGEPRTKRRRHATPYKMKDHDRKKKREYSRRCRQLHREKVEAMKIENVKLKAKVLDLQEENQILAAKLSENRDRDEKCRDLLDVLYNVGNYSESDAKIALPLIRQELEQIKHNTMANMSKINYLTLLCHEKLADTESEPDSIEESEEILDNMVTYEEMAKWEKEVDAKNIV